MLYHSARGSVGYSIVGTPTIINNVVSDFSGRNYIQSASTFPGSTATSLEFATKFNISSFASASTIVSSTTSAIPFHLAIVDSKFKLYPGRENIYKVGNFMLSANTDYWIKLFWDSTTGWKLQYSTDGINYTTDFENYNPSNSAPKDNYIVLGRNYPKGGQEGLLGTLDLNHTYITVNGQPWFGICPIEVKKHQIMGPVGYTAVGSPTIVDGVASDFSSSNLLQINNFDPSKPFVISTKIRFTATGERQYFVGVNTSGKIRILIFTDQKLLCNLGGASSFNIGEIKSTQELSTNKDYFVKLEFTGSKYILSLSEDNTVYSIVGELVSSAYINGGNKFNLQLGSGNVPSAGFYFRGSIDLNETYIKVNGKLWFWQPQETKRIVVNGVEVWTKPE